MIGAISPITSLFTGSIAPRASVSSASSSANSRQPSGVTTPQDVVEISGVRPPDPVSRNDPSQNEQDQTSQEGSGQAGQQQLSQQQDEVAQLKETDRSVHAHEQAHAAVGGSLAGAPTYHYTTGPDGHQYAIGGEVSISIPSVSAKNPQASVQQLRQVIAAATAPADPSGQDRAVAAQAQAELGQAEAAEAKKSTDTSDGTQDSERHRPAGTTGTSGAKAKTAGAPQTTGSAPSSGSSGSTAAATTGGDAQAPAIQIIGPPAFGTKKTADKQTTPDQSSSGSGDTTTGSTTGSTTGGSSAKVSSALIFAYQQVQSSTGQSRNRGASALNLSI